MKKISIITSIAVFLPLLLMPLLIAGCGNKNVKEKVLPPNVYYNKALYAASRKDYGKAAKNFKALIENYPTYRNAQNAELKLGDAYYMEGKYIEAQGAYLDFITLHPKSSHVPFAMFYEAMSYYKRKEATGRSQEPLKHAKATFENLISNYPDTKYAEKSYKYIKNINEALSENDFFTGLYYYNASMWKPAIYTFKNVIEEYGEKKVAVIPKTLYYLSVCYGKINKKKLKNHYINLLKTKYPSSIYSAYSK